MPHSLDDFIQVHRTFHELSLDKDADDDSALIRRFGKRSTLSWAELTKDFRIILLSEAGTGKTMEIRNIARTLRGEGKSAFFVRIEHVCQDLESAFEEGNYREFNAWLASREEGWLLLDSVDEARLRDPKDFERAIKKIGISLSPALHRAHILITGRTSAWRARTDLDLCRFLFPFLPAENRVDEENSEEEEELLTVENPKNDQTPMAPFRVVAFDDLEANQIEAFLLGRKVDNIKAFRQEMERKDAWHLAARPQDLAELIDFWKDKGRIGSRLELIQNSIKRRLEEPDQDRAELRPFTPDRLRQGARLIAAATTLTKEPCIRVPDGSSNSKGIPVREILPDWDDRDCGILLSRPIFDEGIYGTVRFHHRSVREYLTAEWLSELLKSHSSRIKIEELFFRSQYGIEVVVPTMRPVLSWLALLDSGIFSRVSQLAPEILLEGGDPSSLPIDMRRQILRQVCETLSQPAHGRSFTDFAAIQRFASPDLGDEIRNLLISYSSNSEISWFLLRMIWHGEIKDASDLAKDFSLHSRENHSRLAAIRALALVGSASDNEELRKAILHEDTSTGLNRDLLTELIYGLPTDEIAVDWLLESIKRASYKEPYSVDRLGDAICEWISNVPTNLLPQLATGFNALLDTPPFVERGYCEISNKFIWLTRASAIIALRLIQEKDTFSLELPVLSILRKLPIAEECFEHTLGDIKDDIKKIAPEWQELNFALFWRDVEETRASKDTKKGERLTESWQVGMYGHFWDFSGKDFDRILDGISKKPQLDDRLISLSMAFSIYIKNQRPTPWRIQLRRRTKPYPELSAALDGFLHPPNTAEIQRWRKRERQWKARSKHQAEQREENKRQWKLHLLQNVEQLRDSGRPAEITNHQHYLHEQMRAKSASHTEWTTANWRSLIPDFGEAVATAFRDGAVRFWRGFLPKLRSEGAPPNSIPFAVIFGLTGLYIEANEIKDWPITLSKEDARLAARYALYQLNGFPAWLPDLYRHFTKEVLELIMTEVKFELRDENLESKSTYVLYDTSWSGQWMWDDLAELLFIRIQKPLKNTTYLRQIITIISGSKVDDQRVAGLAGRKARATKNITAGPLWYAFWVGSDPDVAIPALEARLAELRGDKSKTLFAMRFITALLGGRGETRIARQGYRAVAHLKRLFLLIHAHVKEVDDIDRVGKGVYTPELRDDAQDARNTLLSLIRETSGKEAYLALLEISRLHPTDSARPWMAFHAKEKAAQDADTQPWTPGQVVEFHTQQERSPRNHRDLWRLAVQRFLDFKHEQEDGDTSTAAILIKADQEVLVRNFICNWLDDHSGGRYLVNQEEELADAKRPDLRFHCNSFEGPVPVELKIADKWPGPSLFERLEVQLCGDYLRGKGSSRGIFVLVYRGAKTGWDLPNGTTVSAFSSLVDALRQHWVAISSQFKDIDEIAVLGIDLTKRHAKANEERARKQNPSSVKRKKSTSPSVSTPDQL
ncbi:NACHT domain-containing protein [Mesoterricola silvestris]|uniref:Uncharacterized protein n=1 Tax=Mesoterricola silvestris TaxID=2927979 RepID=A0AA48H3W0_9BACT|nr:hypothetical protein [Mesoterricola silvestris]BDU71418.1 hypothetical protein METEAL_05920 [Mesoterricola silvestris]